VCHTVEDFMQVYTLLNIGGKKHLCSAFRSKAGKVTVKCLKLVL
jgi:hypothetical protein